MSEVTFHGKRQENMKTATRYLKLLYYQFKSVGEHFSKQAKHSVGKVMGGSEPIGVMGGSEPIGVGVTPPSDVHPAVVRHFSALKW